MRWKNVEPLRHMLVFFANKGQLDELFTNDVSVDRLASKRLGGVGLDLESAVGSHSSGEEIGSRPLVNLDFKKAPGSSTSVTDGYPSNVFLGPCFLLLCLSFLEFESLVRQRLLAVARQWESTVHSAHVPL